MVERARDLELEIRLPGQHLAGAARPRAGGPALPPRHAHGALHAARSLAAPALEQRIVSPSLAVALVRIAAAAVVLAGALRPRVRGVGIESPHQAEVKVRLVGALLLLGVDQHLVVRHAERQAQERANDAR